MTLAAEPAPPRPFHVVFDVSDVINYFRSARLPTGIQRVQIEVVGYAIRDADFDFQIACFTKEANYWIEIPRSLFSELSALSVGEFAESDWSAMADRLESTISTAAPFKFAFGSMLLNLGSSWWLQNYFLGVRAAKAQFDILYVPFIHDLIPLEMPELCVAELRNNFEEWIESVFAHADFFLVNSQNTLTDLKEAARKVGVACEAAVVTLDADFRAAPTAGNRPEDEYADTALQDLGLEPGRFVLFVSTIEPRKNHALAFMAWLKLLRRHGAEACPKLVCVGQRGWLNSEAHLRLAASPELMRQVVILSDVSDVVLSKLYEACLCTLYPSKYEGWGLPVTESLCFGKVPVASRVASLPEAGGAFAEYFDTNSERTILEAVERVVFDSEFRLERERKIEAEFRPRRWADIGAQIVGELRRWAQKTPARLPQSSFGEWIYPVPVKTGLFYSLAGEIQGARGRYARRGEIFRNGRGWWWPEPWGCWIRGTGPARLAFVVEGFADVRVCIYLGLRGVQGYDGTGVIRTSEGQKIQVPLCSEEEKTIAMTLEPRPEQARLVVLSFTSDIVADFRPSTKGRDFRVCGIGVKWIYVCREDDVQARIDLVSTVLTEEEDWIGLRKSVEPAHPSIQGAILSTAGTATRKPARRPEPVAPPKARQVRGREETDSD
jgi:glycosyltransferase involved in cell wall biosynthesis